MNMKKEQSTNKKSMESIYLEVINNLSDGVYFVNNEREILFWNKAAEEITGYRAEEIIGKKCQDSKLSHIDFEGRPICEIGCPLYFTLLDEKQRKDVVFVRHKAGYRIPITVNIFPMKQEGKVIGAVEIFTKNSPKVYEDNLVEHLSDLALHDALTGLPNRRYLKSFLSYQMDEFKRFGKQFGVLFADIDNFGGFNNQYGHDTGDAILKNISDSIKHNIRKDDLVGRWGGEEFVGIYPLNELEDAALIGEKFRSLVWNTEVVSNNECLHTSVSVGITIARETDTEESIIERADHLMYLSKRAGKNCVSVE